MNNIALRTLIFVGVAIVCVGGAVATSRFTEPVQLSETSLVGEEFYPDFHDSTTATALQVAAYDKDAAEVKVFRVEFKDGLWRIPSHHDYPADGEEQLARTAASVVGIKRGTYAGKTPADQKRMGVLDPLDESVTGTEGRGTRITLYQGDKSLVDLIIGNKLEGAEDDYYVRKFGEPQVYRAELSGLKISTKFADWIEPDLLKLDRNKLSEMIVDRYHIDEERGAVVQEEQNVLRKPEGATTWTLEGLNAETEKVKTATINQMTFALDDLKIVGVRPKPAGLVGALTGRDGSGLNQIEFLQMQRAGFFLAPDNQLLSNEGEIIAGTSDGIVYSLRFGEVLSGSELEIEVGAEDKETASQTDADAEASAEGTGDEAAAAQDDVASESTDADADEGSNVKKNRYLFVTASFSESLLGEKPQEPVKPEPPGESPVESTPAEGTTTPESGSGDTDVPSETNQPAEPESGDAPADNSGGASNADPAGENNAGENTTDEAPSAEEPSDPAATEQPAADPAAEADADPAQLAPATDNPAGDAEAQGAETPAAEPADPEAAKKAYEEALAKYEADKASYDARLQAYNEKVEAGKKQAKELNERFAPWYYVISAELFDKLHVARADLVEPVTPAASGTTDTPAGASTPSTTTEPGATEPGTEPQSKPEAGPQSESQPETDSTTKPESTSETPSGEGETSTNPDQPSTDSPGPGAEEATPEKSDVEPAAETPPSE